MFRARAIALFMLLSYFISSGALESPGLLVSYYVMLVALQITIILIITNQ